MGVGINVEHLNAWYGTTHTLQDINLNIPANHATALIGPSGCGKSTFVRCLNRMHETNPIARATGVVKMGEVALPSLIKGLGDRRPSRPLSLVSEQFMTVSVACTCILMELIYKLPDDYPGSLLRKGADGRMHRRPVFNSQIWGQLDEDEELKTWLGKRSSKSLKEIQIEAMSWIIKTENKI